MEGQHLRQHHLQQQQQIQHISVSVDVSDGRFPQWSIRETKELLVIRAELDRTFMETKRNKLLWEVISNKMKEKGFNRSPDQCKFKWKNLVTRYKGLETMEPERVRQQFPFYNEVQAILAARMERMLWAEAEGGGGGGGGGGATAGGSKKKALSLLSSDDEEENEDSDQQGEKSGISNARKRKKGKMGTPNIGGSNVREMLAEFMNKQIMMELEWREMFEAREKERRGMELEWRQKMEALENQRLMLDRRWREREEQRRIREEARAEKRDQLITTLLNKLITDDL